MQQTAQSFTITTIRRYKTPHGVVRFDVTIQLGEVEAEVRGITSNQILTPRLFVDKLGLQDLLSRCDDRYDSRLRKITTESMNAFWHMPKSERAQMMDQVKWDPEGPSSSLPIRKPKRRR